MEFYKDEGSLSIWNDGTKEGRGYQSKFQLYNKNADCSGIIGAHHLIQNIFSSFIWKNSLFMVTGDGNIYCLSHDSKLESIKDSLKILQRLF